MKIMRIVVRAFCVLLVFIGVVLLFGEPTNGESIIPFFLGVVLIYISYRLYLSTLSKKECKDILEEEV